ncbi:putative membrane protein [Paenochrobactrum gallinarii]|uniref:Putative membrane protein n=1 Tax=Paenochrobactrum gallinarii TaxID=643673 RepID=A0A841LUW8_9HYPH|nr:hypothetical protein [Paenochrobactrum gallinarii]MBB6260660.1 putative membrane protein [Paenochrobactrum gallinarii]
MFENKLGLRFLVVLIPVAAAIFYFLPSGTALIVAYWLANLGPAIAIGAIVGWLAYSRKVWLITTALLLSLTVSVAIYARDLFDEGSRYAVPILAVITMSIFCFGSNAWSSFKGRNADR